MIQINILSMALFAMLANSAALLSISMIIRNRPLAPATTLPGRLLGHLSWRTHSPLRLRWRMPRGHLPLPAALADQRGPPHGGELRQAAGVGARKGRACWIATISSHFPKHTRSHFQISSMFPQFGPAVLDRLYFGAGGGLDCNRKSLHRHHGDRPEKNLEQSRT